MSKLTLSFREAAGPLRSATSEEILSVHARSSPAPCGVGGPWGGIARSPARPGDDLSVDSGQSSARNLRCHLRRQPASVDRVAGGCFGEPWIGASVYPREMGKEAMARNAAA